ncbi:3-deoxy-7-phosphoheptulonate synthase, partial [Candidatus Gottesmanbacteria bacterium RIFCSPHIGHO2_01_FULL_39_10]
MIIFLKKDITTKVEKKLHELLAFRKVDVISVNRRDQRLLVVTGRFPEMTRREVEVHAAVESILETDRPYKLASKSFKADPTLVKFNGKLRIGGSEIIIMAGPCSVESKSQINQMAKHMKESGTHVLRGGAFKPRTAPYDFQGLGKIGLHFLKNAAKSVGMPIITEVLDVRDIELIERFTDIFQVGTRNMQNYALLKELGKTRKPVLLKRGMWATYKEFLLAAEYILVGGNEQVILCERGIRTHVQETRFTLDLNAVAYLKHETHLPVVVDPSHGTGRANMVRPMSRAAIAAGADGLLLEVHFDPRKSISDADQAISVQELNKLIKEVKLVAKAVG